MAEPPDDALLAKIESCATDMARGAGDILSHYFGNTLDVQYKDEDKSDPVTNADTESQDYLKRTIVEHFPDHAILGEEDQDQDDSLAQDFIWALDPLDGTKNFLNGLPVYACSVGVMHRGEPVAGAVFLPWPNSDGGVVLHARRGGGAFAGDEPISVMQSDGPEGRSLVALPGYFGGMWRFGKPMRGKVGDLRVTGSSAYELAMIARGVLQYSVTTAPYLWDVAGGAMLVMEAGGLVMRGQRTGGLRALVSSTDWEPMKSFMPSWEPGKTTMTELRGWRQPIAAGSPSVVRYVTSNMQRRMLLRRRVARAVRRLKP